MRLNHEITIIMAYRCTFEQCDKVFSTRYNLKRHEDTFHLHLRPYVCTECFKDFASKQNLIEHGFLHAQSALTPLERPASLVYCKDIAIPKLTDMVRLSDDMDLRPGVVVRRIYPYPVPFMPCVSRKKPTG